MFKKSAAPSSGYNLTNSLRFRSSASAYLNRTLGTPTNSKIWTYSGWVKRGSFSTYGMLLTGGQSGSNFGEIYFDQSTSSLNYFDQIGSSTNISLASTAVYRDPAAWYHIVVAVNTTQATSTNRVKLYVNGVQVTDFSTATYPSQNANTALNTSGYLAGISALYIGSWALYSDQYLAEVNFIDGQQLTPSSFGSTNSLTGVWQPAKYTGTYGTNGFYLPFTDTTSTTTLGYDFSGNSNNWTTNNISLTAGTTYDSMTDVPTLTSATVANYCVWNPLNKTSNHTASDGNLTATSSSYGAMAATIGMSSGKWYWEVTCTNRTSTNSPSIGYCNELYNVAGATYLTENSNSGGINSINGNAATNATSTAYGSAISTNDVVMFAFDATNKQMWVGKNGTWFNSGNPVTAANPYPYTITGSTFFPAINCYTDTYAANFGQRTFSYTPPTGFVALNTYNLPTSTIVKGNTVMDATTYTGTGNGVSQTIINAGSAKPDLVWVKSRSGVADNVLFDSIRGFGGNKELASNNTQSEGQGDTASYGYVSSANSNGFTVTAGSVNAGYVNSNGATYVGWQWQAGQGSSSSNTNGSITSTVSVNASAGFSVVTYTNVASGVQTVGHGLGVAPSMIIVKFRSAVSDWGVYHSAYGNTGALKLNTTGTPDVNSSWWNNTSPTSSVFTLGTQWNGTQTAVAYCWSQIAGFSSFGSYTGNGSADGPFIYTGFRPKFIMIKRSDSTSSWYICDTSINTYNEEKTTLYPNLSNAEGTNANFLDGLSNGFKMRESGVAVNSATYVYAAFAENPFKNALAR
jgi:hypothetical protein